MFKDRVVLITGAASGIGRELASRLAIEGARLVLTDANEEAVKQAAADLGCEGYWLDVRLKDDFERLVASVEDTVGPVDFLFNNAGVVQTGPAHEFDYDDWKRVIDINVYGVVNGVYTVYPRMVKRKRGHIINTASIAGLFPSAGQVSYSTSKYAVVGLSQALRGEAELYGVRVTVVCPGIIKTAMRDNLPVKGGDAEKLRALLPEGMPVEECVSQMLAGVKANRGTVVITPMARGLYALNRLNADLSSWVSGKLFGYMRDRS